MKQSEIQRFVKRKKKLRRNRNRKKKNTSHTWTLQNNIVIEIELFQQGNYNNIRMEFFERK